MKKKATISSNREALMLAAPRSGRAEYRDTKVPALTLRVSSGGTKTWCVSRKVGGRFVRVTLGTFMAPDDTVPRITVERARVLVRQADGRLAEGVNVNEAKRKARSESRTLAGTLAAYLRDRKGLKPRTREDYTAVLHEFCSDWLARPVTGITRTALEARHRRHGETRSKARADNAVRVLRTLFNFAGVEPNPAASPKRRKEGEGSFLFGVQRRRTVIREGDLPAWWSAVQGLRGRDDGGADDARDVLRLLLLTGLRVSEACGLEWAHVDVKAGVIEVPDTKNHDPHVLPVGKFLHGILRARAARARSAFVFPSRRDPAEPYPYETMRIWIRMVTNESGVAANPHDLRRTFATIADSLDLSGSTVKRLLNHRTGRTDVTAGYIVPSPERLRAAMQRIEDRILSLARHEAT